MAPIRILLVEDNPGDVRLAREAFNEAGVSATIEVARDGVEAWDWLAQGGRFSNGLRPDLILLDLNLPRRDGRELLRDLKADPDLRRIPVLILTTSAYEEDILKCYDLHANGFISKPSEMDQFVRVVRAIDEFWLKTVRLSPAS